MNQSDVLLLYSMAHISYLKWPNVIDIQLFYMRIQRRLAKYATKMSFFTRKWQIVANFSGKYPNVNHSHKKKILFWRHTDLILHVFFTQHNAAC